MSVGITMLKNAYRAQRLDRCDCISCKPETTEALRRDAERWRFYEAAGSDLTLRLHNTRSDHRNAVIEAAMAQDKR